MADYEREREENSARSVDWEVVSLTASAYSAAPGPEGTDLVDDRKDKESNKNEEEYARSMFMSGHFVFPPSEHENLPLVQDVDAIEETDIPDKTEEGNQNSERLFASGDLHTIQFVNKGDRLCEHSVVFEEGTPTMQGLKLVEGQKGENYDLGFSSFHNETDISESVLFDGNCDIAESDDPLNQSSGFFSRLVNQSKDNVSGVPCESWWKRQAASLHAHAKEARTFWSLCVAAAVMGLVILGQRWQQERWQAQHLKYQFSVKDEKISRFLGPVTRFKDVFVGSHRRTPVIQGGFPSGP